MTTNQPVNRKRNSFWYLLLLLPFIGTLYPPFYTSAKPELSGIPFFYWYQLLWVPLSAIVTGTVYLATR